MIRKILTANEVLRSVEFKCYSEDFRHFIQRIPDDFFLYLDPPYARKGYRVYTHCFQGSDHIDLADLLRYRKNWLLSFDDDPRIRNRYGGWAIIEEIPVNYLTGRKEVQHKRELLIYPD
ncbi:MAG: DNA adenine methylase [Deltaproteobacteria bacterium]|nr:DNA adenine methylase [Deltaproteobacteria bacterium]